MIEVGARGYCAYNVRSCLHRLGMNAKETKKVLSELTATSIQCSFVIWLNRLSMKPLSLGSYILKYNFWIDLVVGLSVDAS